MPRRKLTRPELAFWKEAFLARTPRMDGSTGKEPVRLAHEAAEYANDAVKELRIVAAQGVSR
jgi:hypothetical protein